MSLHREVEKLKSYDSCLGFKIEVIYSKMNIVICHVPREANIEVGNFGRLDMQRENVYLCD